ncbi:hypothetical protein SAMN05421823_102581 [Catalinimonas alkaloidigena]|uniref:Uncharacterized protein n=2 Tax=Catalinimonas alkaloidigena TaxID=1075417 RepID=A0A1G9BCT7_9BACT|nr:hypothetical protein SAMN05421823_102581 [Catalinimonas alkaloidigena]
MVQIRHLIHNMVLPIMNQRLNLTEQRELRRFLEYPDALHGCHVHIGRERLSVLQQLAEKQYIEWVRHDHGVDYFRLMVE